jgi:hypothetical protein
VWIDVVNRSVLILAVALQLTCADRLPTDPTGTSASSRESGTTRPAVHLVRPAPRVVAPRAPIGPTSQLAGKYTLTTSRACAGAPEPDYIFSQTVFLTQAGDRINFLLGVDTGFVEGTIDGKTIDLAWQQGLMICPVRLTGKARMSGRSMSGSVSGEVPASGCDCAGSMLTITFGMVKQ